MFDTAGEYLSPTTPPRPARCERSPAETRPVSRALVKWRSPRKQSNEFLADVWHGLGADSKFLPCKYLYDKRGSELFDRICETDEYYVTRTEIGILTHDAQDICEAIGPGCVLVELGSGSSVKTRILLEHLDQVRAYFPVDISADHLHDMAADLRKKYPRLLVQPLAADFACELPISLSSDRACRTIVFFPGSTIGNFSPAEARGLFRRIAQTCGPRGGLLIGFDLRKPRPILEAAYDDAGGVTAAFTLNLLRRINRELGADFDLANFRHEAVYEDGPGRMRISLVSVCRQRANVGGRTFSFESGERVLTEHSYKYTLDSFEALLGPSRLAIRRVWTDPERWFAVALCESEP